MAKKLVDEGIYCLESSQSGIKMPAEVIYHVNEFSSAASKIFGMNVRSECVLAAFRAVGKESATLPEAKEIVKSFLRKEIK